MSEPISVSLTEAAEITGITYCVLKRWRDERRFLPASSDRTCGNKHHYKLDDIRRVAAEYHDRRTGHIPEGYITIPEASKILKVTYMIVQYRATKGHFGAKKVPRGSLMQWVVVRKMVEASAEDYAKLGGPCDYRRHERPLVAPDDTACLAARREKLERDGIRIDLDKLFDEWKRTG